MLANSVILVRAAQKAWAKRGLTDAITEMEKALDDLRLAMRKNGRQA